MISDYYKSQLKILVEQNKFRLGKIRVPFATDFIEKYKPNSILDWGCGDGSLIKQLGLDYNRIKFIGYDPSREEFSNLPNDPVDAVISNDVFEHFEPEFLDHILETIDHRMEKWGLFRIACYPAKKTLPDGRNCHLIVKDPDWWKQKILETMRVDILEDAIEQEPISPKNPYYKQNKFGLIYKVIVGRN